MVKKKSPSRLRLILKVLGGILVAILLFSLLNRCSADDERKDGEDSAAEATDSSTAAGAPRTSQAQTTCPPFSELGATCEVQAQTCTGWIRMASSSLAGKAFEWGPWPATDGDFERMYHSVRYLDSRGIAHKWRPGMFIEGALAWNYCPKQTITLTYWMAEPAPR